VSAVRTRAALTTTIVLCTAKNAAKVAALGHNPAVVLTIDTEVHPPKILLIRGRAENQQMARAWLSASFGGMRP
jgi:hypothetical protein